MGAQAPPMWWVFCYLLKARCYGFRPNPLQSMGKIQTGAQKGVFAVATVLILLLAIGYFAFYKPQADKLTYERNVECSNLVTKYQTDSEVKVRQLSGGGIEGVVFGTPKSHFNKALNTCLGSFSSSYTYSTEKEGVIMFTAFVTDVVRNEELLKSVVESRTSNGITSADSILAGVGREEYKQQELSLMSN